jgi:hypothetical protein
MRSRLLCVLGVIAATGAFAGAAEAKVTVSVLGWSTAPLGTTPEVKNHKTIKVCNDTGNGQRGLRVIFRGKGITKSTKVGVGLWGGPRNAGMSTEPTNADVMKTAFKWPVPPARSSVQQSGFSFAKGPFGPIDINGEWNAKIVIKSKVVARGTVTVAC